MQHNFKDKPVLIIEGPEGSGKTTLANKIVATHGTAATCGGARDFPSKNDKKRSTLLNS